MGAEMNETKELHAAINSFERFAINQDKDIQRLQAKIRGALAALQTGAALDVVAAEMKEQHELQDMLDQLEKIVIEQDNLIEKLEVDALRYRWLRKYSGQMFMATEQQVDVEVDRAMSGGVK